MFSLRNSHIRFGFKVDLEEKKEIKSEQKKKKRKESDERDKTVQDDKRKAKMKSAGLSGFDKSCTYVRDVQKIKLFQS